MEKEKKKSQFFRTVAGKTVLFIAINISFLMTFLCVTAAAVCVQEDLYTKTEAQYLLERSQSQIDYSVMSDAEQLLGSGRFTDTSISIQLVDQDGKVIASTPDFTKVKDAAGKSGEYVNTVLYSYDTFVVYDSEGNFKGLYDYYLDDNDVVSKANIIAYLDPDSFSPFTDFDKQIIHMVINVRYIVYPVALLFVILGIVSFIALMCVAGKRPGTEEVYSGPLSKVPFDVLAGFTLILTVPLFMFMEAANGFFEAFIFMVALFVFLNAMLGLSVSVSGRVKNHMLIKGTLIYKCFYYTIKGILKIPLVWRTVLIIAGLSVFEAIVILASGADSGVLVMGWFLEKLVLCPLIFYISLMMRKLRVSGEQMAKGDISYRTSTKGLWGDFKKHAVNLNAVADSVTLAVDEKMKSERMKTELITNVSHDIKTPLTSIINYASLMGTTDPSDPKMSEYSEVVVRQSEKLKRLIEDLVEASKASTGNLEIVPAPLDCCTFISQTAGEYKEKIEDADLSLVATAPEEPVMIMADGRRMMRIYDNLMNNICKYSQPGTRVYLTLEVNDGIAVTTFKNTSSAELNISADELVERFVRGDQSRNTEGNGLGLSIAKSMTELQSGTFAIDIDGDLFKVTLSFPVID